MSEEPDSVVADTSTPKLRRCTSDERNQSSSEVSLFVDKKVPVVLSQISLAHMLVPADIGKKQSHQSRSMQMSAMMSSVLEKRALHECNPKKKAAAENLLLFLTGTQTHSHKRASTVTATGSQRARKVTKRPTNVHPCHNLCPKKSAEQNAEPVCTLPGHYSNILADADRILAHSPVAKEAITHAAPPKPHKPYVECGCGGRLVRVLRRMDAAPPVGRLLWEAPPPCWDQPLVRQASFPPCSGHSPAPKAKPLPCKSESADSLHSAWMRLPAAAVAKSQPTGLHAMPCQDTYTPRKTPPSPAPASTRALHGRVFHKASPFNPQSNNMPLNPFPHPKSIRQSPSLDSLPSSSATPSPPPPLASTLRMRPINDDLPNPFDLSERMCCTLSALSANTAASPPPLLPVMPSGRRNNQRNHIPPRCSAVPSDLPLDIGQLGSMEPDPLAAGTADPLHQMVQRTSTSPVRDLNMCVNWDEW
eukprot:CAMPEP_0177655430 /NCGR_PEP_ID=MMETSP0447-20121125/14966_1 /TAXON_ID=0 /ORGANISM="Stygamoeba regulata, Strain BSH-02190019" /LENGTH=474 /DNA_ID=CAMNT_0019159355 /DNA_START=215 /DNA_END=1636 /DNA_ORIENTATION=-